MKALVLAALLLPPIGAAAVSPEDAYLAARDRYIASFKTTASAKDEKAAFARHDKAVRDLEQQLKAIVGPFSASGFPAEGKLNLVSLFPDDIGFGMLDGLVYGEGESAKSIVVTTDSLLDKWLLGRPKGRSIDDIPTSAAAAVKTENFYAQAVNSDSAAANYGEIPVAAPPGAKFAHAMLSLIGNGPLVPGTPDRIFVALEQGGRVFIVSEKLATRVHVEEAMHPRPRTAVRLAHELGADDGDVQLFHCRLPPAASFSATAALRFDDVGDPLQLLDASGDGQILLAGVVGMQEVDLDRQEALVADRGEMPGHLQVVNDGVADRRAREEIPLVGRAPFCGFRSLMCFA